MSTFLITTKDKKNCGSSSIQHHRKDPMQSHCYIKSDKSDGVNWKQSALCLHCRISGFVDHSSAFQLSHHTFRDRKDLENTSKVNTKLDKEEIRTKKKNNNILSVWFTTFWALQRATVYLEAVCLSLTLHIHLVWSFLLDGENTEINTFYDSHMLKHYRYSIYIS